MGLPQLAEGAFVFHERGQAGRHQLVGFGVKTWATWIEIIEKKACHWLLIIRSLPSWRRKTRLEESTGGMSMLSSYAGRI